MAPARSLIWFLLLLPPALLVVADVSDDGLVSFLTTVQSVAEKLNDPKKDFDPKPYVDRPLKKDLPPTESAFQRLSSSNNGIIEKDDFSKFLKEFFEEAGRDLVNNTIPGFLKVPQGFLPNITNHEARKFGLDVHLIWKVLARKVRDDVPRKPFRHTLLPLPHPVVVPGARFREVYYWDSYWIIRGLLVSKLHQTANSLVENLLYLLNTYGFIPNGARRYYTNRSQPPLLSQMIKEIYLETKNISLVQKAFPALLNEHDFWSSDRHRVSIRDEHGTVHSLTRYNANWSSPRPESYTIDVRTAKGIKDPKEKAELYHQIATTAETGLDFSSRWLGDRYNLTTLKTSYILPVDLNSYLFQMEKNIDYFAKLINRSGYEGEFNKLAELRRVAMNSILWSEEKKQYLDYWLVARNATLKPGAINSTFEFDKRNQNPDAFPTNFVPLWSGVASPGDEKVAKLVASFKSSGLLMPGGVATSLTNTSLQWDYPNAWAPLQHVIVEGLAASKTQEGLELAHDIARRWLRSNHQYFVREGFMVEKYDATTCGKSGAGGEYTTPAGFGWSNGVVLSFLDRFGWPENATLSCQQ